MCHLRWHTLILKCNRKEFGATSLCGFWTDGFILPTCLRLSSYLDVSIILTSWSLVCGIMCTYIHTYIQVCTRLLNEQHMDLLRQHIRPDKDCLFLTMIVSFWQGLSLSDKRAHACQQAGITKTEVQELLKSAIEVRAWFTYPLSLANIKHVQREVASKQLQEVPQSSCKESD